eukprot:Amastigsp_a676705_153.p2 type:complete len:147 gc:universal Amastigsp_a676705_153:485-925(+)
MLQRAPVGCFHAGNALATNRLLCAAPLFAHLRVHEADVERTAEENHVVESIARRRGLLERRHLNKAVALRRPVAMPAHLNARNRAERLERLQNVELAHTRVEVAHKQLVLGHAFVEERRARVHPAARTVVVRLARHCRNEYKSKRM